ncbi:aminotransferase class V-fold PLP-dependent enzyme [Candidatus Fermentibacteria bacterium]|nr:aminotransferase class V-fold PLP-dependent enzyme [Candidatus Fermentibacteria bacterium]
MRHVYFDSNATTRVAPEVLEEMMPYFDRSYGNPSSFHSFGSACMEAVEKARKQVADLIGAAPEEVFFTSGGTESDNTALKGAARMDPSRNGLVVSAVEHPAVLETARYLERRGHPVFYAGVDSEGSLNVREVSSAVDEGTALVSLMAANNETGVLFPVDELAKIAHGMGALYHTDAVQAVGKIEIDVRKQDIDLLSISAHKLHGPMGAGALFVRRGIDLPPLMHGGHQEEGLRAGTLNVPGIVGLGKAAELAGEELREGSAERLRNLRNRIEEGIISTCPETLILASETERLPNTLTAVFGGIESEAILTLLDMKGISASSGSACSTGTTDPSHVLTAMGCDANMGNSAIRISFDRYTTEEEVDYLLEQLPPIVEKLRDVSPYA